MNWRRYPEVFGAFLVLGSTSFGGPVAHLGYFRREFVQRRRWLDEATYADLVALCQFLPGAASSQVGMAVGIHRAGIAGGLLAWLAFTLPSASIMLLFAYGAGHLGSLHASTWLHGLGLTAVAVVAQAVWTMSRTLCVGVLRRCIAVAATIVCILSPTASIQVIVIAAGALAGWLMLPSHAASVAPTHTAAQDHRVTYPQSWAALALLIFAVLLLGLPVLAASTHSHGMALFDSFFRTGSLVFGGGHVVLPLLQQQTVPRGWLSNDAFLAGYGAAQAIPGPLFTFAAYLGAAMSLMPNGVLGASICLMGIFLPSLLLVVGTLPIWYRIRHLPQVRAVFQGVNAAVVGVLLAALYNPVFIGAIHGPADLAIALAGVALLIVWGVPSWAVVLLTAGMAAAI